MKIEYSPEHDIMYIKFLEEVDIDDSLEENRIVFDYSKDKKLVAVEILDARKRVGKNPLEKVNFSVEKNTVTAV